MKKIDIFKALGDTLMPNKNFTVDLNDNVPTEVLDQIKQNEATGEKSRLGTIKI